MNHLYLASLWSQHQNHQVRNIRSKLLSPPKNIGFYRRVFSNRGSQVLCKFAPRSRSERKAMKRAAVEFTKLNSCSHNSTLRLKLWPIHKLEWIMSQAQLCWYHRLTRTSPVSCSSLRVILAPLDFPQLRYPPPAKHVHPGEQLSQSGWWPLHGERLPQILSLPHRRSGFAVPIYCSNPSMILPLKNGL